MTVNSAEVISIQKIDNSYAPKYKELEEFFDSDDTYECYMVGVDMSVNESTQYYFDGINYKLIIMVKQDDIWGIGAESGRSKELLENAEGSYPVEDALQDYAQRELKIAKEQGELQKQDNGISTLGIGSGFITSSKWEPTTIKVGKGHPDQNYELVFEYVIGNRNFCNFIENGTTGEIGNMGYHNEAIKANLMAVKMFAWFCVLGNYRSTYGCDIIAGYDVAYDDNRTAIPSSIRNAKYSVNNYGVLSSGGKFFTTNYRGGSYTGAMGCGILSQNGSNQLANQGYSWKDIIHYYYDNSTYNHPNVGIVKIVTTNH